MLDTARAAAARQNFETGDAGRIRAGDSAAAAAPPPAELEDLKLLILALWREVGSLQHRAPATARAGVDFQEEVRRFESDLIRCALIRTGGRQRRAARLLGIKAATLNAKIKRYRIDADEILSQAAALRLRNK